MSIPLGNVIKDISLEAAEFLSGGYGITHTIDENVSITNDLSIGTGPQHTGTITMNDKIYSSVAPSGTETSGGIATYDAALHFSIYDGKELRFYNYDGSNGTATAYAGIKSSTETASSGYTLTLPSGVSGKSGQYLMLSDNTGTLQWNSIAGATSPLLSCKFATTENLATDGTAYTYANGSSGVGATLTRSANAIVTIDGQSLTVNDRILVKDQPDEKQNGIYLVTRVGTGSATLLLTRVTDFNSATNVIQGKYVYVESGTANSNKSFILLSASVTVGTNDIEFSQFSVGGLTSLTSGQGLSAAGGDVSGDVTVNVDATQTGISSVYHSALKIGTASDQEYITFGTSNEVNTFVNNTERLSVTNTGIDVTGTMTLSGIGTHAALDVFNA
jgi:hypothetical protein